MYDGIVVCGINCEKAISWSDPTSMAVVAQAPCFWFTSIKTMHKNLSEITSFHQLLNYQVIARKHGYAKLEARPLQMHMNSGNTSQGGYIATLLDIAGGLAGLDESKRGVTLSLSVNYLERSAPGDVLSVEGVASKMGKSVWFSHVRMHNQQGKLIAEATGSFKYLRASL